MLSTFNRIGIGLMILGFVLAVMELSLAWIFSCVGAGFILLFLSSFAKVEQTNNNYLLAIAEHSKENDQEEIPNQTATRGLLIGVVVIALFAICAGLSIYLNHPVPAIIGFFIACTVGFFINKSVFEYRCKIWQEFADQRGLHFTSGGIWNWTHQNLSISGMHDERSIRLLVITQRTSNSHRQRLMVNAGVDVPLDRHFCIDDGEWQKAEQDVSDVLNSVPRLFFKVKALDPIRFSLFERELSITLPRIPQTHAELDFLVHLANQVCEQLERSLNHDPEMH